MLVFNLPTKEAAEEFLTNAAAMPAMPARLAPMFVDHMTEITLKGLPPRDREATRPWVAANLEVIAIQTTLLFGKLCIDIGDAYDLDLAEIGAAARGHSPDADAQAVVVAAFLTSWAYAMEPYVKDKRKLIPPGAPIALSDDERTTLWLARGRSESRTERLLAALDEALGLTEADKRNRSYLDSRGKWRGGEYVDYNQQEHSQGTRLRFMMALWGYGPDDVGRAVTDEERAQAQAAVYGRPKLTSLDKAHVPEDARKVILERHEKQQRVSTGIFELGDLARRLLGDWTGQDDLIDTLSAADLQRWFERLYALVTEPDYTTAYHPEVDALRAKGVAEALLDTSDFLRKMRRREWKRVQRHIMQTVELNWMPPSARGAGALEEIVGADQVAVQERTVTDPAKIVAERDQFDSLLARLPSERQRQVAHLLANNLAPTEIAEELGITRGRVSQLMSEIRRNLTQQP